jgi:hypothetical protein
MQTISKKDFSEEDWELITDSIEEFSSQVHRRGSNFFVTAIYEVTEDMFPDRPELWGFWESDAIIWDADWGFDDDPLHLTKVHQVPTTVVVNEWQPVA